jgi:hypothetical protein
MRYKYTQARPASGPLTWHDMKMALSTRAVKSRGGNGVAGEAITSTAAAELGLQKRLLQQYAHTEVTAEGLYGNDRATTAHNMYR